MSFKSFGSLSHYPRPADWGATGYILTTSVVNAANEGVFSIGQIAMDGGPDGGSKTISSSGGGVVWKPSTNTFVNAGTTLRLGIQDLSATAAKGDGTWDAYADLVGGTDTITSGPMVTTPIGVGSKSVAHGDWVAIGAQMISRGGTDSVAIAHISTASADNTPHPGRMLVSSSSVWTATTGFPSIGLVFDDGTYGFFHRSKILDVASSVSVNVNTATADEYGNLIIPGADMRVSGMEGAIAGVGGSDPEINIYSDPLGTPVLMESVAVNSLQVGHSGHFTVLFTQTHLLKAGQVYAVTVRPTTTTNMSLYYEQVDVTQDYWLLNGGNVGSVYAVRRINNSGAFSDWAVGITKGNRMLMALLVEDYNVSAGRAATHIGI